LGQYLITFMFILFNSIIKKCDAIYAEKFKLIKYEETNKIYDHTLEP
jgi:hypothetical protein